MKREKPDIDETDIETQAKCVDRNRYVILDNHSIDRNMRSIPDAILDRLQDDELKHEIQTPSDGQEWYNPNPEQNEFQNAASEIHQLYHNREQRIRRQFRAEFYPRSCRYAIWVLASVLSLATAQWAVSGLVEAQTIGITTTIIGSVVLGISLLRGPYSVIKETSAKVPTLNGENMDLETLEYVRATIDDINGISYVILGFLIQLVSIFNV